jgi:predicted RNase H-like HicB family nuclease
VETKTYTAVCRRTGRWWAVAVPELDGVFTQARCLDQVEQVTRDTIARIIGVGAEDIEIRVQPELPGTVSEALQARHVARLSQEAAREATTSAVHALLRDGCTIRDAGLLLGLSPEEISLVAPGTDVGSR